MSPVTPAFGGLLDFINPQTGVALHGSLCALGAIIWSSARRANGIFDLVILDVTFGLQNISDGTLHFEVRHRRLVIRQVALRERVSMSAVGSSLSLGSCLSEAVCVSDLLYVFTRKTSLRRGARRWAISATDTAQARLRYTVRQPTTLAAVCGHERRSSALPERPYSSRMPSHNY